MTKRQADDVIKKMPRYLKQLEKCPLIKVDTSPEALGEKLPANAGVYVFYENCKPKYAGRSDDLKTRIGNHKLPGSRPTEAACAVNIVKKHFEEKYPDSKGSSTRELQEYSEFGELFDAAKKRVREMDVRVVEIKDPNEQVIFEVYAHIALNTPYNIFETT